MFVSRFERARVCALLVVPLTLGPSFAPSGRCETRGQEKRLQLVVIYGLV
jgi:hypothetical protein